MAAEGALARAPAGEYTGAPVNVRCAFARAVFLPVNLQKSGPVCWLPKEVEVIVDLDDVTFVNVHHFTNYTLFGSQASE